LWELATAACLKNIKELQSVGDYLPYQTVRHILLKVDNAWQLRQIEINSPQIEGETGELWLKLIEREFPLEYKANAYKPQHPSKWYKVWEKYKKDHDIALEESERKLKLSLAGLQEDKEKNTSKIVDRKDKKYLPREPGGKRHWSQRQLPSNLTFGGGKRTSTSTGAGVMRKVRREVKELKTIHGVFSKVGRRPVHQGQIKAAPAAMVNDYQRAAQPTFRSNPKAAMPSSAVTEYEKRAAFISDSDEDDGDDDDRLFDDAAKRRSTKPFRSTATSDSTSAMNRPSSTAAVHTALSPGKRPSAGPSSSSAKRSSGLLSNSYKPPASRNIVTKTVSKPASRPTSDSKPRPTASEDAPPPRSLQQLPRRQTSPPDASSAGPPSPPPTLTSPGGPDLSRKRKATSIFMRPRKRP
jgi:elongin-A